MARFLEVAATAGADGVDLTLSGHAERPAEIAAAVRASGLQVSAIHALTDWALPDDADPRPALSVLKDAALAANAPLILCVAPLRMDHLPPAAEVRASASARLAM
ncbi:MAG TPA: hypothetical protein VHB98_24390, partial [Chloroflexota bacterium]|nr:hypothetical protein [Chloroflexota bacterium]